MIRVAFVLLALAVAAPAFAQSRPVTPALPTPATPQSSTGTPSSQLTPQPFSATAPTDPTTGLPSNLPRAIPDARVPSTTSPSLSSPSASPSFGGTSPLTLPPPVWSTPSPPAGQPLTPGSR